MTPERWLVLGGVLLLALVEVGVFQAFKTEGNIGPVEQSLLMTALTAFIAFVAWAGGYSEGFNAPRE